MAKNDTHDEGTKYSFKKMEEYLNDWYSFRYNEVTNEIEFKVNAQDEWKELNEMELNGIFVDYRKKNIIFSKENLSCLIFNPSIEMFNPFLHYFQTLPKWDGTDYIQQLSDCVTVAEKSSSSESEKERFYNQFKKQLLRILACAIDDNYFNKHAFILIGEKQNQYKTSFLRYIIPPTLKRYYTENFNSDQDKDSAISLSENLIINIDELAGLTKFDINKLKSTLSRQNIKVRLPFGKRAVLIPRRCSIIGSSNNMEVLTDVTGNVRWIIFQVLKIDSKYNTIPVDMLWAQVFAMFQNKTEMQITLDEIKENEASNTKHMIMTSEMELVLKYFKQGKENDDNSNFFTATDIMDHLSKTVTNSLRLNSVNFGRAMTYFSYTREQRLNNEKGYAQRGYYVKCSCNNCEEKLKLSIALSNN